MFKKPNLVHIWRMVRYGVETANKMALEEKRTETKKRIEVLVLQHELNCVQFRRENHVRLNELERARNVLLRKASEGTIDETERSRIGELTREIGALRSNEHKKLSEMRKKFRKKRAKAQEELDIIERHFEDRALGNMA